MKAHPYPLEIDRDNRDNRDKSPIVKTALRLNAGAVLFAHNHPSGMREPSRADEVLTRSLRDALAVVDVKVLDHFIVAGRGAPLSFVEHGLL